MSGAVQMGSPQHRPQNRAPVSAAVGSGQAGEGTGTGSPCPWLLGGVLLAALVGDSLKEESLGTLPEGSLSLGQTPVFPWRLLWGPRLHPSLADAISLAPGKPPESVDRGYSRGSWGLGENREEPGMVALSYRTAPCYRGGQHGCPGHGAGRGVSDTVASAHRPWACTCTGS